MGYGLDGMGFDFLQGLRNFSLLQSIQTGSAAHPASYPMDNGGSFLNGKTARM
jgi:hypothetical protein